MTRLSKMMGAAALVALVFGAGCKPQRGTANPEDYFPLILVAMDGGKTAAMIGRNEFLGAGNFAGCVSMETMIMGFGGVGDVLAGKMNDKVVIPGFDLDLADCLALRGDEVEPLGEPLEDDLEEDSADEITPLIEGVASVALSTAEFYANRLKGANCKKGTATLAAIAYLKGLVTPIAKQVAEPGSPMSVPAVVVDLSACE